MSKIGFPDVISVSWTEQWILAKLYIWFYCDTVKSWLDSGNIDLIFKVTIL